MKTCRECNHQVSESAIFCPNCGAPYPGQKHWTGWGWEYKSTTTIGTLPLLHISFKYRPNRMPVVAKGVIAIGQFAAGMITISQFGVGIINLSQFGIGLYVVAQFALAYSCIAQFGLYLEQGWGQFVRSITQILGLN
ncbi:zinc-ribbon domain-containing protein [Methylomarinum vadi]|uniref:zinc-ribbon domain-containing protein n=1 Tax=Methylomarinum vadi TaxID=438855 RepID=UPI0004DEE46D|nr:zinc ribbon domain-containing protein [Methylomarinum vadi]